MKTFKIVVAGVGGQGTLLASRLLAVAAIKSGLHVKIGETYGMAQRGGPVMGHIQIGGNPNNPQIRKGEADILIGFEPAEAVRRGVTYLKEGGLALINTKVTAPVEVVSGMVPYPDIKKMIGLLRKVTDNIHEFIRQRRRIATGHLQLFKQSGRRFIPPTYNFIRILKISARAGIFRLNRRSVFCVPIAIILEATCHIMGRLDNLRGNPKYIWERLPSTKRIERPKS